MCGICGEVTFNGSLADVSWVDTVTKGLKSRGPDNAGVYSLGRVCFGHRRLRIIDLTDHAHQPMVDSHLGLAIVFNGCIYNYKELRKQLEGEGYSFFSTSDTEVVVKSYHFWGISCVERFNGMFAAVIVEQDSGKVITIRDRLGIKPLYYSVDRDKLRFASALPALLQGGGIDTSINPVALHYYMSFHSVIPAPHTIINGVKKQPPASVFVYEPDGTRKEYYYWSLNVQQQEQHKAFSVDQWEELLVEALMRAVKRRMVADVPVGVLLSGGVDSSFIVGLLANAGQNHLNTFSIGFESTSEEEGNEFKYSDVIAERFQTQHHKIVVGTSKLIQTLPETIRAMSEPMVSHDNVGFYLLSHEVSKHLKVVQSGQGADEVFAGYHWYPPLLESQNPVSDYSRVFFDRSHDEFSAIINPAYVSEDYSRIFVEQHFSSPGAQRGIDKALRMDTSIMLVDDPVKRVDNMTMAWGLEARVPFLDHELVELAGQMPAELKVRDDGKWILKKAARKVIPPEVIDRPKGYFPVPELKYIEGQVLDYVKDALESQKARERAIFNRDYIDTLYKNPKSHITQLGSSKLWQIALLELWLQANGI